MCTATGTEFKMYKILKAISLKSTQWKAKNILSTCLGIQQSVQGPPERGSKSGQWMKELQEGAGPVQGLWALTWAWSSSLRANPCALPLSAGCSHQGSPMSSTGGHRPRSTRCFFGGVKPSYKRKERQVMFCASSTSCEIHKNHLTQGNSPRSLILDGLSSDAF